MNYLTFLIKNLRLCILLLYFIHNVIFYIFLKFRILLSEACEQKYFLKN